MEKETSLFLIWKFYALIINFKVSYWFIKLGVFPEE